MSKDKQGPDISDNDTVHRFSISVDDIVAWYRSNKSTLVSRYYGKDEEAQFALDLIDMLSEITQTSRYGRNSDDSTEKGADVAAPVNPRGVIGSHRIPD